MPHLVYRLQPHEYSRYRKHLLALDEASRYTRFGYQVRDEMIDQLCTGFENNPKEHKIFVIENDDLEVVACAVFVEGDKTCTIITGEFTSLATVGHEVRHCFEGLWHK